VEVSIDPTSLQIVVYPDPILTTPAHAVDVIDPTVEAVAERMLQLMHKKDGAGLAAPQVGLPWRMFVTHDPDIDGGGFVWINPSVTAVDPRETTEEEGCLSLPGIHIQVRRPQHARLEATTLTGQSVTTESQEWIARVWQHEFDHINGRLIIDRMSTMDRLANRKAIKSLQASS